MRTWIVVCDASRARFFQTRPGTDEWIKFEEFEHPPSRLKASELVTDRQGRKKQFQSGDASPRTDPHDVEELRFAHHIATTLDSARAHGAFDRLVIVAPPVFLGQLRAELSDQLAKMVYATLDRDYTQLDEGTLQERVTL